MSMSDGQFQLSKMADAAARREARRRKILENSQNRLQIISGKSSDEFPIETPVTTVIPEPEYDFPSTEIISSPSSTSQVNGVLFSPPTELLEFLSGTRDIDASGDGEVNDLAPLLPQAGLMPPSTVSTEVPKLTIWETITTYKYDIVLLSLLLQILYNFSITTFDNGYLFFPVIIYIVTKMIWFPTQSSSSIANVLMLLNGVSPTKIQRILYLTQCFGIITRDIFIFLFTTICVQSLCITLKDNLVT